MGNDTILWLVLTVSVINLVLLCANLWLLRQGYSQARQQTRLLIVSADGMLLGEERNTATRHTAIVGADGGLLYPDGGNGYARQLRASQLEPGTTVDVFVVPSTSR